MRANCFVFTVTLWCVIVAGIFGDTDEESAVEGESFTLRTDIKKQPQETVLWNYEDTRIAQINRDSSTSCLYDGPNERFRDRLEVDYESGYLTITDIRFEHAGQYEGEIIRSQSSGRIQTFNNKKSKCDSTKSIPKSKSMGSSTKTVNLSVTGQLKKELLEADPDSGLSRVVAAVVVVVVLLLVFVAAAVVIYCRHSSSRKAADREKETKKGLLEEKEKDDVCVACENPTT